MTRKSKQHLYGFVISACLAGLCFLPARHFGFRAYTLWLSQDAASLQQSHIAARYNHLWVAAMLTFDLLAVVFLFAGYRSRRKAITAETVI